MQNDKKKDKAKQPKPKQPPMKPSHPNVEGTPDDNDPNAQYENKDES